MIFTETKSLSKKQKNEIILLWNKEYPKKLALRTLDDFEKYLQSLGDKNHIILTDGIGKIKGWLIYFIRDGERWFAMIIDSSQQGKGLGSKLLNMAKARNTELNGWVIDNNLESKANEKNYQSPTAFYRKNDFRVMSGIGLEKSGITGIKIRWKKNSMTEK